MNREMKEMLRLIFGWRNRVVCFAQGAADPGGSPPADDPGATGGGAGAAGGGAAGGGDDDKTFTQTQVDSIIEKRLGQKDKAHRTELQKQLTEVEDLKKAKNLTEEQRATLAARADELESALMTEKEKASKEKDKVNKKHKEEKEQISNEKDKWRARYEQTVINNEIMAACAEHEVYNSAQIVALLKPCTALVEEKDDKLNPTGKFVVKVKAMVKGDDGKPTEKEFTVDEYIKHLSTLDVHANLFRANRPGGTGFRPGTPGGVSVHANMTPREKIAAGLKTRQP